MPYKWVVCTSNQKKGILLQKYRDTNGNCIAILSKVSWSGVHVTLLNFRNAILHRKLAKSIK